MLQCIHSSSAHDCVHGQTAGSDPWWRLRPIRWEARWGITSKVEYLTNSKPSLKLVYGISRRPRLVPEVNNSSHPSPSLSYPSMYSIFNSVQICPVGMSDVRCRREGGRRGEAVVFSTAAAHNSGSPTFRSNQLHRVEPVVHCRIA
jgi:hypothetical protein